MSPPWFFVEILPPSGGAVALDAREARHATGSRRLSPGDEVMLFDGKGGLASATIEAGAERSTLAARVASIAAAAPPPAAIHLAAALPKGDRAATMLAMATQLGMTSFTPLVCARGIVEPGPTAPERWSRILIEACKQSRRPFLPSIHHAGPVIDVATREVAAGSGTFFAHPGGEVAIQSFGNRCGPSAAVQAESADRRGRIALLVGPEGGFTNEEVAQLTHAGARQVDLGPGILRIETAAALMVGLAMLTSHALREPP